MPNFIEIGQTSLEKSVKNITFSVLPDIFCHGQKRDYLSRVSQTHIAIDIVQNFKLNKNNSNY